MPSEGNGRPLLRDGRPLQRCSSWPPSHIILYAHSHLSIAYSFQQNGLKIQHGARDVSLNERLPTLAVAGLIPLPDDWESSCKGVKIFYQDGRGKTFSTSREVGRNKSWAETTSYRSDTCPFVPFGIECASQDRTNPWPTGVPVDGSKGALPSRPSPLLPQAQKPSNNKKLTRDNVNRQRAQCGVITADYRTLIRVASA
jgi:hypothetical protein